MKSPRASIATILAWIVSGSGALAADWIWSAGDRMDSIGEVVELSRSFLIDEIPSGDVKLRVLGDFCRCEVLLNGTSLLRLEPYDPAQQVSVKRSLRAGENQLVVKARGVVGPSVVALDLVGVDGEAIVSSGAGWVDAISIAPLGELQLGDSSLPEISALDEYNQWKEAKGEAGAAKFSPLPKGFKLEQLRAAKPDEGSWISMAFDPKGRLVISREKRGLLRLDLASGAMELVEDTLLEVRGLLFAHGVLYANANNSKGLFRLRDSTGDERFDEVQLLMKTEGGVGHGRNDLALGPDGMIYSIHGDSVKLPDGFHQDRKDPKPNDPKGYLIRIKGGDEARERDVPDALRKRKIDREVISVGLRNPYGISFNLDGEAFTYDADNEGDIGLPLYRPARVNHLVAGANYGWMQARGESWPVYTPESLPTTFDAGRGSPTAVEFRTKSRFPRRYREALFILDWAYGRIVALDVIPNGASYRCRAHTFLRGRPLNVTDLTFGPDGAMYFITSGRGTQSALYRVRYEGGGADSPQRSAQEVARREFSQRARETRRELERLHGMHAPMALARAWKSLGHADPWIRHAALVALESQEVEAWEDKALEDKKLSALLALARSGHAVNKSVREFDFSTLARFEKLMVLRILELELDKDPGENRNYLAPLFPDGDLAVDRELSKLLVKLGEPTVVPRSLDKLAASESQFERLHYLNVLSRAKSGWTLDGRRAFFRAIHHPDYFRGDRNMPGYLMGLRERAVANLTDEERAALGPLINPAKSAEAPPAEARALVKHWKVDDLLGEIPDGYKRDAKRGREIFVSAACNRCHQIAGFGSALGPNLTVVASRFSRRDLVEAIVEPSKAMAEAFRNLVIKKKDGTIVIGRVVRDDFRESTISISSNPLAPTQLTLISKHDIESHQPSPISPMPPGLLDTFSQEEIFQLLDFLENPDG